jgi:hypothetical protein
MMYLKLENKPLHYLAAETVLAQVYGRKSLLALTKVCPMLTEIAQ